MLPQNLRLWLVLTALALTRAAVLPHSPRSAHSSLTITGNDPPQAYCFEANPDIAGLGVLIATYIQVFISIFITLCAAWDQKFKGIEVETMTALCRGTLLLSCANAISGIVQLSKKSLNAYHASIILSLGLLLDGPLLGTSISISMSAAWVKLVEGDWKGAWEHFWRVRREMRSRYEVYDAGVHSPLLSGLLLLARALNAVLSIAILSTISLPDCGLPLTGGLGMTVLGTAFKVCWGTLSAIRLFDVVVAVAKIAEQLPQGRSTQGQHDDRDILVHRFAFVKLLVGLVISVMVVVDVELLRLHAKSAALISEEESDWGFGQILAICVLTAQLIDISGMLWQDFHGEPTERQKEAQRRDASEGTGRDMRANHEQGRPKASALKSGAPRIKKPPQKVVFEESGDDSDEGKKEKENSSAVVLPVKYQRGPVSSRSEAKENPEALKDEHPSSVDLHVLEGQKHQSRGHETLVGQTEAEKTGGDVKANLRRGKSSAVDLRSLAKASQEVGVNSDDNSGAGQSLRRTRSSHRLDESWDQPQE